jgi:hypothetical protein
MEKTFTVAGVSTLNGKTKLRFANDIALRVKVLARNGHDAIRLIELDTSMTKAEAAKALAANEAFADVRDVIDAYIAK